MLVVLLTTATITFAAETRQATTPTPAAEPTVPDVLLVPDVRGQAYVFAKTTLEESGFAWRVGGSVRGYSANLVSTQAPAPGTRVLDTGAPTIVLTLSRNGKYGEEGAPEDASPYAGTEIRLPNAPAKPKAAPEKKKAVAPKKKAALKKKAAPTRKVAPKKKAAPKKTAAPKKKAAPKPRTSRPHAFVVPGAKPEPLDEIPLTARAEQLKAWVEAHPRPTDANVRHWLYQHSWIVTGARLGWWRGAEALELLIAVDRKVQRLWGVGKRSERVARAALAEVRRKAK